MVIGDHVDVQYEAATTLATDGPLTHDELRDSLGVTSRDRMQAVIRGLQDNGVIEVVRPAPNEWKYAVADDVDPNAIYQTSE